MIGRTHEVTVYRGRLVRDPDTGRNKTAFDVLETEVGFNIQPRQAALRPTATGESDQATLQGFCSHTSAVAEDDRLVITQGRDLGPLKVLFVGDPGDAEDGDWDLELDLVKVDEAVAP